MTEATTSTPDFAIQISDGDSSSPNKKRKLDRLNGESEATAPPFLEDQVSAQDISDLTIVIGRDDTGTRKRTFRALKSVMAVVSPVWNAAFGPNGRFSEASKSEVAFPDDDPDALLLVLRIAHHFRQAVASSLKPEQLRHLAILCDKYDVVDLVRPVALVNNWGAKWNAGHKQLITNLVWGYNFGDRSTFEQAAREIAMDISWPSESPSWCWHDSDLTQELLSTNILYDLSDFLAGLQTTALGSVVSYANEQFSTMLNGKTCVQHAQGGDNRSDWVRLCTTSSLQDFIKYMQAEDLNLWPLPTDPYHMVPTIVLSPNELMLKLSVSCGSIKTPYHRHTMCNQAMLNTWSTDLRKSIKVALLNHATPQLMHDHIAEQAKK